MIQYVCFLTAFFAVQVVFCQIQAVTEEGDEVVLYEDGTWEYVNPDQVETLEVPILTSDKKFTKEKNASFKLKSGIVDVGVYLNPKLWKFEKSKEDEDAEFSFQYRKGELYGQMINEKFEIPIETLRSIAVENARDAAPDMKVIQQEYRIVNGVKVLMLQMRGTIQGIKIEYMGYYYSSESGSVQLITFTSQSLFPEYESAIEKFLNGFVEL